MSEGLLNKHTGMPDKLLPTLCSFPYTLTMGNAIKRSSFGLWAAALSAVLLAISPRATALEGQGALSPAKIKEIQANNQSYKNCTEGATAGVKAGKSLAQDLPKAFERCRDKYPGAALFLECKKKVLAAAKGSELDVEAVGECKKLLTAASFDPAEPVPLFVSGNQAFFAGLGMNREMSLSEMELPNFTCEKLQTAVTNVAKNAQHILFGNHPNVFVPGAAQAKFLAAITRAKPAKGEKFSDVDGFGRLFGEVKSPQSIVYFPSAPCDFKGASGVIFSGLSLYYLADSTGRTGTPYFGIAYYREGQKSVTTPELVTEVSRRLGRDFKAYSKDAETVFILSTPFKEVDKERDPRNICQTPRAHQFVGVVHTSKKDHGHPDYLILANIRNLCDYGDRQAGKLAR